LNGHDRVSYTEHVGFTGRGNALRAKRYPLIYRGCAMGSRVHRCQCANSDRKLGHEHPCSGSCQKISRSQPKASTAQREVRRSSSLRQQCNTGQFVALRSEAISTGQARDNLLPFFAALPLHRDACEGCGPWIQTAHGPDRRVPSALVETMPSASSRQACANTVGTSSATRRYCGAFAPASLYGLEMADCTGPRRHARSGRRHRAMGQPRDGGALRTGTTVRPYPRPPRRRS
jgi:hypothetical protein